MKRTNLIALITATLALIAAIGLPLATAAGSQRATETLQFDVAEDMSRFIFDKDVVYEDGMPKDGSAFITRGYLYPVGTLACNEDGCNGVNKDGSPEFPDKVIGEWICQGYLINEAAHATSGVWVFSSQFFQLGTTSGAQTLVTQGYELADVGVAISRAITGGTGDYKDVRGQSEQQFLGFNASEGVALRVTLEARTR
ncbi:hypothetical protein HC891_28125 [Candidatus Gracilibacteria bacterium]|nr:hypothetical protein [Candidatus Gracilibacteria bacterium]